jgi:hypothetical protein
MKEKDRTNRCNKLVQFFGTNNKTYNGKSITRFKFKSYFDSIEVQLMTMSYQPIFHQFLMFPFYILSLFGYLIKIIFPFKLFKQRDYLEREIEFLEFGINVWGEYPKHYTPYSDIQRYFYNDRILLIVFVLDGGFMSYTNIPMDSFPSDKDKNRVLEILEKNIDGGKSGLFQYVVNIVKIALIFFLIFATLEFITNI